MPAVLRRLLPDGLIVGHYAPIIQIGAFRLLCLRETDSRGIKVDFDPAVHDEIDALADRIWARIVGAHADPIEFNLRAKLALEMRMLGSEKPPFGLDRLSAAETASYVGVQTATLQDKQKRRALGIPEPYNIGRKLYWRRSELDPWIEKQRERRPTNPTIPLRAFVEARKRNSTREAT